MDPLLLLLLDTSSVRYLTLAIVYGAKTVGKLATGARNERTARVQNNSHPTRAYLRVSEALRPGWDELALRKRLVHLVERPDRTQGRYCVFYYYVDANGPKRTDDDKKKKKKRSTRKTYFNLDGLVACEYRAAMQTIIITILLTISIVSGGFEQRS